MDGATTSIGGVLAAMVYQIEQANASLGAKLTTESLADKQADDVSSIRANSLGNPNSQFNSQMHSVEASPNHNTHGDKWPEDERAKFMGQLDDMFNAVAVEHGVAQPEGEAGRLP